MAPLALSGSWIYSPPGDGCKGGQPGAWPHGVAVATPEPFMYVPELSVSGAAFGHVSGALFGRIGRDTLPELDFEDDQGGDGPFSTQIRLSKQLRSVCVSGTMSEPPPYSQDSRFLIGLTAEEMRLHQSRDSQLPFGA